LKREKKEGHNILNHYLSALLAVGVCIPILAVIFTLLGYFWFSSLSLPYFNITLIPLLALILTIIVWFLLALFFMPLATARGGKLSDYEIFQGNLNVLRRQFKIAKTLPPVQPYEVCKIAMAEIQGNLDKIYLLLKCDGLTWVLRTGYISLWYFFNKANEAMIDVLPAQQVIEGAKYDIASLTGSQVPNREDLIEGLRKAIKILCLPGAFGQIARRKARSRIRQIRAILQTYRNERWDNLVRARNQLMGIAFLTSVVIYILVDIAILVRVVPGIIGGAVPVNTLEQISILYLFGAVIGLFGLMLNESNRQDADIAHMDDYGLKGARIFVTPLLSGLAALVGVLVAAIVLASTQQPPLPVDNIYNFCMYPQGLIYAAVFGYTPSLVIGLLKRKTNKIQCELHVSSPADHTSAALTE
jgi:hypothetical protein